LLNPLFAKEEIEREKGVIQEEIRMYTEMPMRHIHHLWQRALFGGHPLGRRIDGSQESVGRMRRPDFVRYVQEHYHSENTVVVVAGKFAPERALALVTRLFAGLSKGSETFPTVAPVRLPKQLFVGERRASLEQTHIMVGVPGVSLRDDRRWAVELLATILGSGMSSRMFLNVRERHGLAYAIRTSADGYTDAGSLVTQAGVRTPEAGKALDLILREYNIIMEDSVGSAELSKAKQMLYGHLMLELEETNSLALFVGGQELLIKEILTPDQIKERIESVSAQILQQVAQDLFAPHKRAVAVLGPHRSWSSFERILEKV
jgi:predicted Zn-dependent peptidase